MKIGCTRRYYCFIFNKNFDSYLLITLITVTTRMSLLLQPAKRAKSPKQKKVIEPICVALSEPYRY